MGARKLNEAMFRSDRADWGTPRDVYGWLSAAFGGFTVDVCASEHNAKCERYFDKETDGLLQSWEGQRFFCNPPYGDQPGRWLPKGRHECTHNRAAGAYLVASRVDADWFRQAIGPAGKLRQSYYVPETDVWWLRYAHLRIGVHHHDKRLMFEGAPTQAPFPSSVIMYIANGVELLPDVNARLDGRHVLTIGMPR